MPSTNSNASKGSALWPMQTKRWTTSWMRRWRPSLRPVLALTALCALAGCVTPPLAETPRLLKTYPEQAQAAAQVAPDFTRDALKTINRLEANQKTP
jgi:hypothetical protein